MILNAFLLKHKVKKCVFKLYFLGFGLFFRFYTFIISEIMIFMIKLNFYFLKNFKSCCICFVNQTIMFMFCFICYIECLFKNSKYDILLQYYLYKLNSIYIVRVIIDFYLIINNYMLHFIIFVCNFILIQFYNISNICVYFLKKIIKILFTKLINSITEEYKEVIKDLPKDSYKNFPEDYSCVLIFYLIIVSFCFNFVVITIWTRESNLLSVTISTILISLSFFDCLFLLHKFFNFKLLKFFYKLKNDKFKTIIRWLHRVGKTNYKIDIWLTKMSALTWLGVYDNIEEIRLLSNKLFFED